MINPTGKKLEKLLFGMFDDAIQGVDRYNHNGCLWLIFTDEMRWVVEYTKTQTLWYNYYFFKNEMEMVGLDCVEDKDLIQKWFELRFLNMNEVKLIDDYIGQDSNNVEDTIQNGVKNTKNRLFTSVDPVEDTIQNGVKNTVLKTKLYFGQVEDTIQSGVKETRLLGRFFQVSVEDTIQTGVKHTKPNVHPYPKEVRDTIQNGVKHTEKSLQIDGSCVIEDTVQNGVKNTYSDKIPHEYDWSDQFTEEIEDTIKNGVKETCKSESTKSISLRRAIQNGVKHCEDGDWLDGDKRFEDIIQNGEKK